MRAKEWEKEGMRAKKECWTKKMINMLIIPEKNNDGIKTSQISNMWD